MVGSRRVLFLAILFLIGIFLVAGCEVVVVSPPPVYGEVRVCTHNSSYYARVYIDGYPLDTIDGWGVYASYCTVWHRVTLNEPHEVVLRDVETGERLVSEWVTPTYDGYTIEIY